MRPWTDIMKDLREDLDINRVKTRVVSKTVIPYLEGDDVIKTANRIFDEDGWDAYPLGRVERFEVGTKKDDRGQTVVVYVYTVPYMVRFHGLLDNGEIHTIEKGDIGKNSTQSMAYQQHEMAISGCATDALKRAMRHLGRQFGLTLYDNTSDDFQDVMRREKLGVKKAPSKTKKEKASSTEKESNKEKPAIQRALEFVIPEELVVEGKNVRLPNAGKTIEQVLDKPLGDPLLLWLAGLQPSPAGTPPFVPLNSDETKLQNAVSYVLLNKRADILDEDEVETLRKRFVKK